MTAARTPRELASAVRREAEVRPRAVFGERALRRAARDGGPILLGPWLSEIGHELEYWIPFMRRELGRLGVSPEQVTVMTRGGAALWYRGFAANELDILSLLPPEEYLPALEARWARAGDLKMLRWDRFDRELVARARDRLGDVTVAHPSLMFTRLRGLWFKDVPLDELWPRLEFRPLEVEPQAGLPRDYIAVKAYFNECLPADEGNRAFLRRTLDTLAEHIDVVLLSTGLQVDDHEEWVAAHERVHAVEHLLRPEDNLAVQTRIVAGARGLVATYGGFSYLGPLLGVPTIGFLEIEQTMPIHLEVIRRAVPGADYAQVKAGDDAAVGAFVSRVRAAAGS